MLAPIGAAAGTALKQVAWAIARRQSRSLLGKFWKALAVGALVLVVAPVGLVVVSFLALAESVSGGFHQATGAPQAPMLCPVSGATITQGFGPTSALFEPAGFGYPHFHTGIDLAAQQGTQVRAASDGFVEVAGMQVDALGLPIGYGNYVKVGVGGGVEQIYGHLSSLSVAPKGIVRAGDPIGGVGSTGSSTGPHLHFEVRVRGVPVDPSSALQC
jgi:murein DD-endopeptidase MepM/ murein hydrolase activator NlpD